MMVESIKMASMSKRSACKRLRLNNPEEISKHFEHGKPVMLVTAHYGNWEWGSLTLSASFKEPCLIVYKPQTNKTFEDILNRVRSRFGALLVPMQLTLRSILRHKGQAYWTVFLGDQTPVWQVAHYQTTFLNQPTAVFLGVEKIAKMMDAPVVFGHINRLKRGYYEATFTTLTETPNATAENEITETHTRMLEGIIQKRPELWLWSHKRWKNNRPAQHEHS
ncbi:lysophospholipid acyltransferase family protein [Arcticibacter sp. MXS-1]|uniref:lysophospholipid acyltransferase family protein n=1 Tax=Arcticibacter sp. MXS-1 TaxID=3341726 RepID=UPI0035A96E06